MTGKQSNEKFTAPWLSRRPPAVIPQCCEQKAPLSHSQRELWLTSQTLPDPSVYNISVQFFIGGPLQVEILIEALQQLMERQHSLRTRLEINGLEPVAVVDAKPKPPLSYVDLESLEKSKQSQIVAGIAMETARHAFDLSQSPLFIAKLARISNQEHVLFVTMHHIIADGLSFVIFENELFQIYALHRQEQTGLSPLQIQYADFAAWQRNQEQTARRQDELKRWKHRLHGALPLNLLAARPRPDLRSFAGAAESVLLSTAEVQTLRHVAAHARVTPFLVMLSAFHALLARYSDQEDVLVGTPVNIRDRPETKNLIGDFLNTAVVRARIAKSASFADLLKQVREAMLEALECRHTPFEAVVREFGGPRDSSRNPLFQVMFVFQTLPARLQNFVELQVQPEQLRNGTSKVDLNLEVAETAAGFLLTLEYATDLFDQAIARAFLSAYKALLTAAIASPEAAVDILPTILEADRNLALSCWNETCVSFPEATSIAALLERQAASTPKNIAVIFDGEQTTLTYEELAQQSAWLAAELLEVGIRQGEIIAICLERSLELVLGLCAVVKAGAVFLLIDPEWPALRIASVLAEAGCTRVLAHAATQELLPRSGLRVVRVDQSRPQRTVAISSSEQHDLCYVVFTSGSTGRPKGALNTHAGLYNRLQWMQQAYPLGQNDVVLQKTPVGFDVCIWEFFWPMITGARLVVARPGGHRDPGYLYSAMQGHEVTVLHFVPAMLRLFLEHSREMHLPSLRRVICSGEALPRDLQDTALRAFGAKLSNLYGPAEAAIDVTAWECRQDDALDVVPIGRPIANCQVYLLDRQLQPVAAGVPGEIFLGGVNVGLGYFSRPELTAERFVPDPFHPHYAGARLYRTGDIGRCLPDGNIVFLGRIDDQVKVGGQRIEPGEVAQMCRMHPFVGDATVILAQGVLVAYVTPKAEAEPPRSRDLRRWLSHRLPRAAVPRIAIIPRLPLNANGKVDRAALPPAPEEEDSDATEFVAPVTPMEMLLAEAWAAVLQRKRIGTQDNFFDLGGDSIRMIQVLTFCARRNVHIAAPAFYRYRTISDLAPHCVPDRKAIVKTRPFALISPADGNRLPDGLQDAHPLSRLQAALLYFQEQGDAYRVYFTCFHVRARYVHTALAQAAAVIIQRHPLLRSSIDCTHFSEPLVLVHPSASLSIAVRDLTSLPVQEQAVTVAAHNELETRHRFDWTVVPLLRVTVLITSGCDFHVTIIEPWLDGWSAALVGSELLAAYAALVAGRSISLSNPPDLTYAAFVEQERAVTATDSQRDFWRNHLAEAPSGELHIPIADEAIRTTHYRYAIPLPERLRESLEEVAMTAKVPLKTVLLAAHTYYVSLRSARRQALTAVMGNGRPEVEGSDEVVGLFLNALPFRLDVGHGSWLDLIRRVFQEEQVILEHRVYPFSKIQEDCGNLRIDSLFNFTDFHPYRSLPRDEHFELLEVTGSDHTYFPMTAQFSLTMKNRELRLSLDFCYCRPPFAFLESVAELYRRILCAIAFTPEQPHARLGHLTQAESRLLVDRNKTEQPRNESTIHSLFARWVASTPAATALLGPDRNITFTELNSAANRLAHLLRRRGVRSGARIVVSTERSPEAVLGFLAVLKAGALYIPLQPNVPRERANTIFHAAGAQFHLVISGAGVSISGVEEIYLKGVQDELGRLPDSDPPIHVLPEAPAYVLFTSGSSGTPKGVCMSHGAILNRLHWMWRSFPFAANDVIGFRTPLIFVDSVWEVFGGLLAGIPTAVLPQEVSVDADALEEAIAKYSVTRLTLVPTLLKRLLDDGLAVHSPARLSTLRLLSVSGEPFPRAYADELLRRLPKIRLLNLYGSTEVSGDVTYYEVAAEEHTSEGPAPIIPIGKPIDNTTLYVVGSELQPVGDGVPGELLVGGANLANGYLDRDDLTAERFIVGSFAEAQGQRLFRTGDLVRYDSNGVLHLLGRLDRQVKVRGIRIEPAEIEATLLRYPAVRGAAVIMTQEAPGRLICYVESTLAPDRIGSEFRRFLLDYLPMAMIPDQFVQVDRLPLNSSGKVDYRSLISRSIPAAPIHAQGVIEGPVERELATLWQQVLNRQHVTAYDDFFDLGGNSLNVIQLLGRTRAIFGIEITLRDVFDAPVLRNLAARIESVFMDSFSETQVKELSDDLAKG
ncbi:MAG TPA: amino acid adenylation domain-containing protein [Candidatus Angelobacter sp.]|nr:amino acid adenylation domain-containing protein [Candidatus Angelobacter sp.]